MPYPSLPSTVPQVFPSAVPALANYENQDNSFWAHRNGTGIVAAPEFIGGPAPTFSAPFTALGVQDTGGGANALLIENTQNAARWGIGVAGEEGPGFNIGSDFVLNAYNNDGSFDITPMRVNRSTATAAFANIPVYGNALIPLVIPPVSGNNAGGQVAPVPPIADGGTVVLTLALGNLAQAQHLTVNVAFRNNNTDGANNSDIFLYTRTGVGAPASTATQVGFDIYTPSNATVFQSGSVTLAQGTGYSSGDTTLYIVVGRAEGFPNSRIDNWSVNATVSAN